MANIHPTVIIDSSADIDPSVTIGPYTVIHEGVTIGRDCNIGSHVVVGRHSHLGIGNKIFQFASVGEDCQDKKYDGEPTQLFVGDNNTIREFVTINRGTVQDKNETKIGNNNLFMSYVHIGHDCIIGDDTIFANNATLAGHVKVDDGAILGGFTGVHQYCQIGAFSMAAMFSAINKDVPAFVMVQGNMAKARGMNFEGMRRRQYPDTLMSCLKKLYKIIYKSTSPVNIAIDEAETIVSDYLKAFEHDDNHYQLARFCFDKFILSLKSSSRGIIR